MRYYWYSYLYNLIYIYISIKHWSKQRSLLACGSNTRRSPEFRWRKCFRFPHNILPSYRPLYSPDCFSDWGRPVFLPLPVRQGRADWLVLSIHRFIFLGQGHHGWFFRSSNRLFLLFNLSLLPVSFSFFESPLLERNSFSVRSLRYLSSLPPSRVAPCQQHIFALLSQCV